ncbi:MAG TPA: TetR family transcriptional regulator [Aquabacterium sp.]|uniref:TetR family transcriptional regulator n=1 Tax=Aquabacterium sp. TaxID=1872578 RepID=UPI002E3391BF|nr:TetR family transcriptional regulator [Aquabacterium sp.]HEX5358007.1 TetR family transcriptional regulator [Aquabacterium sp.]
MENEPRPIRTRANDDVEKAARREDIIEAARILYLQDSRALPSVARIAEQAGLAKGTVYTYFTTKEEIFAALLADSLDALLSRLAQGLSNGPPSIERLIDEFVSYIDAHPEVPRLDAMAYQLERNLSPEAMHTHKLRATMGLVAGGGLLEVVMGLPAGRGVKILSRIYALARGLWQWLDYPPEMQIVLSEPVFAPIRPDFRSELVEALHEYVRGATTP